MHGCILRTFSRRLHPGHGTYPWLKVQDDPVLGNDFQQYLGFVMLDFVTLDRSKTEAALGHTLRMAGEMGFLETYKLAAQKELRLRKSQVEQIAAEAEALAAQAAAATSTRPAGEDLKSAADEETTA